MTILDEYVFLILNYDYLFRTDENCTKTLLSSLLENANSLGATFIKQHGELTSNNDITHDATELSNSASNKSEKQNYILTPIVDKKYLSIPQRTIFWLIDVIISKVIISDSDSPLYSPRDPTSSEWTFLAGEIATVSGYRGKERVYIRALLAAFGAVPEGDLDLERTTLVISDENEETE